MSDPLTQSPEMMGGFGDDVEGSYGEGAPGAVEQHCAHEEFFEICVVDEDGEPVADLEFVLTFADGSEQRGRLDAMGTARIEGVAPGEASVEFLPSESGAEAAVERAAE